ncbi:MAG: hypothetical protein KDD62_02225 [Bdellovibrionales bacterium]|nr:hypothetical protein [Bdellovibrionales bacterium]
MTYFPITATAFTILFFELLLIRWVSTEISLFAYLQNSILIVCFLSLGTGLLFPNKEASLKKTSKALLVLAAILSIEYLRQCVNYSSFFISETNDFLVWGFSISSAAPILKLLLVILSVCILFAIILLVWHALLPLGQRLGGLLDNAPHTLKGYTADILGSLLGVWAFTAIGILSLPPLYWVLALVSFLLYLSPKDTWKYGLVTVALMLLGFNLDAKETFWTPYQKISVEQPASTDEDIVVYTNNFPYQAIQDNSRAARKDMQAELALSQYYIAASLHPSPQQVMIVGAGTGNDIAGALRRTKAEITAVEIDPLIVRLGKRLHPETPYQSPRTSVTVDDARAIFQNGKRGNYDLLIMGLLDAHTTPNLSNARLDNFVYTKEALTAAKGLLSSTGVLVLSFSPQRDFVAARLKQTLDEIFVKATRVVVVPRSTLGWGGVLFINGSEASISQVLDSNPTLKEFFESHRFDFDSSMSLSPTSDDWPYLYVERPSIPFLFILLGLVIVALWALTSYQFASRLVLPNLFVRENLYFFSLGAGFILMQVFVISKMSVIFGSTWFVNAIVISGMLITILLANILVMSAKKLPLRMTLLSLVIVCLGLGIIPFGAIFSLPYGMRILCCVAISGIPPLLSGIVFGAAFKAVKSPSQALGANLFGALIGSSLQLIVFYSGISSLAYLSAAVYLIALSSFTTAKASN